MTDIRLGSFALHMDRLPLGLICKGDWLFIPCAENWFTFLKVYHIEFKCIGLALHCEEYKVWKTDYSHFGPSIGDGVTQILHSNRHPYVWKMDYDAGKKLDVMLATDNRLRI